MKTVKKELNLLNKALIPSKDDFLLWMEGREEIILATARQLNKDFCRAGFQLELKNDKLISPIFLRNSIKKSLSHEDFASQKMMQLFYLIDIPEEMLVHVNEGSNYEIESIVELILYRSFTKVYFRTRYK